MPTHLRQSPHDVIVIGAGAAGMMAAAEAAIRGARVKVLEKNGKTGVKILMSGGTRCNITQDTDAKGIVSAFGKSGRFLQKSVGAFDPRDVVRWFHSAGVATKIESTGKIFPESNRAVHVRDALQRGAEQAGVEFLMRSPVQCVRKTESGWSVVIESESLGRQETLDCDKLIVTAGGKSWPGCGTTGDAYEWLSRLGHTIVRPRPALVPLVGGYHWTRELSGLTLDDCIASVYPSGTAVGQASRKQKPLVQRRSSWLFTHFGFSGPAAMDVSGVLTESESIDRRQLTVDFVPELSAEQIRQALSDRSGGGRRGVAAVVNHWLPSRLADAIASACNADQTIAELSRQQMDDLVRSLKGMAMPIHDTRGFAKAEVTAGGVKLSEVDPRTMASRLHENLYIAGEVLDVDGWIGGYNFQAAFSTGKAAGKAATPI